MLNFLIIDSGILLRKGETEVVAVAIALKTNLVSRIKSLELQEKVLSNIAYHLYGSNKVYLE